MNFFKKEIYKQTQTEEDCNCRKLVSFFGSHNPGDTFSIQYHLCGWIPSDFLELNSTTFTNNTVVINECIDITTLTGDINSQFVTLTFDNTVDCCNLQTSTINKPLSIYRNTTTATACSVLGTIVDIFMDGDSFETCDNIYTDRGFSTKAPYGYYTNGTIYRRWNGVTFVGAVKTC